MIFFEKHFWKNEKEKKNFEKDFWKENYLIWATRWTVSCPYSNNPRQRRQKHGGRNCDPLCICMRFKNWLNRNLWSQIHSTNQQVYWVVQVIPYVSKGRIHRDYWFEAINIYFINLSQDVNRIIWIKSEITRFDYKNKRGNNVTLICSTGEYVGVLEMLCPLTSTLPWNPLLTRRFLPWQALCRVSPLSVATSHPRSENYAHAPCHSTANHRLVPAPTGIESLFCVCHQRPAG